LERLCRNEQGENGAPEQADEVVEGEGNQWRACLAVVVEVVLLVLPVLLEYLWLLNTEDTDTEVTG